MKEYAKKFYRSPAWKVAREAAKARAGGLCERCRRRGVYRPGRIAHHTVKLTPENINNPSVALDIKRIEYVCDDCHNKEHKTKDDGKTYKFGIDGKLIEK